MLTKEKFFSMWAKPKDRKGQKGQKKPGQCEMEIDAAENVNEGGKKKTDERTDVVEACNEASRTGANTGTIRLNGRGSRSVELPIFAFQRKGIGVAKHKQYHKPTSKGEKQKDQSVMDLT